MSGASPAEHVDEEKKKGKSVATANAEEGNGVAAKRTDSGKAKGRHLAAKKKSLPSPNHQHGKEEIEQHRLQTEVRISISRMLQDASPSNLQNDKIFKVHHEGENKKFYEPSIISIGPYYHGQSNLEEMEGHKVYFLKKLLERQEKNLDSNVERQEKNLDSYVCKMTSLVGKARHRYLDLPQYQFPHDNRDFSRMMVLDGCFIVELIQQLRENKLDTTVSKGGRLTSILHDLALVGNQLPFFVLWELLGIFVATDDDRRRECIRVLLSTFKSKMTGLSVEKFNVNYGEVKNVKHLVELLYSLWSTPSDDEMQDEVGGQWISSVKKGEAVKWSHIHSASELAEAGIQFKKVEEGSLFAIDFDEGIFKIPSMIIEDRTESLYHNIIAYERHSMLIEENGNDNRYSKRAKLAFYCRLMDCLINSGNDVQLLRKRGIIVNCLGDDEAVAKMFNRLGVHVGHFSDGFFYANVFNEVNDYYNKQWNKWRSILRREHLKTPWALISVVAAVMLFLLTVLQTQFTIFPLASKGH